MDKEIYAKALKEYARSKNKNILKLIKYAKKMNIEEEVVQLMEVLLQLNSDKLNDIIKKKSKGNNNLAHHFH